MVERGYRVDFEWTYVIYCRCTRRKNDGLGQILLHLGCTACGATCTRRSIPEMQSAGRDVVHAADGNRDHFTGATFCFLCVYVCVCRVYACTYVFGIPKKKQQKKNAGQFSGVGHCHCDLWTSSRRGPGTLARV